MTIGSIIGAIIIGLVLGVLGRLFAPGKQNIPIWLTIVIGIVAAFIGTLIASLFVNTSGFSIVELIVQVLVAAAGVYAVAAMYAKRGITR